MSGFFEEFMGSYNPFDSAGYDAGDNAQFSFCRCSENC